MTDCTQSRPVKKTQLESGLPTLWGPRTPQPNPRSHACHGTAGSNQCVYISVRVCLQMRAAFSSCVHTRPAGIRCDGGGGGGGIRCRPSPERALICSAAGSVCCRSACFYGAHEHMRGGTHTLLERPHKQHLKNILHTHTLRSYGLKETHWGCRLNLLKRKNRCIRKKWKGKGCRLMFGNDNNSVSQTRAQRFY